MKGPAAWFDRLNRALVPYLGPPKLGPYDEPELPAVATRECPMCHHPLSEHSFDRAPGRPTYMECPAPVAD